MADIPGHSSFLIFFNPPTFFKFSGGTKGFQVVKFNMILNGHSGDRCGKTKPAKEYGAMGSHEGHRCTVMVVVIHPRFRKVSKRGNLEPIWGIFAMIKRTLLSTAQKKFYKEFYNEGNL